MSGCVKLSVCLIVYPSANEFELCRNGDINCIPKAASKFLKLIVNGREDLHIPRLEPFRVDLLNVTQQSGQFSAVLNIIDADIYGFSNLLFEKAV